MNYSQLTSEMDFIVLIVLIALIAILLILAYNFKTIPVLINYAGKAARNLPRDISALFRVIRFGFVCEKCRYYDRSVDQLFAQNVKKNENKIAIHFKDQKWTFGELNHFSNKTANCFIDLGFVENDEICLMMNNRPEFLGILMGLAKIGVVPSLINTSNKLDFLLHAINAINCKAIVFENCFYETIAEIRPQLSESNPQIKYYYFGDIDQNNGRNVFACESMQKMIDSYDSSKEVLKTNIKRHFSSILCYIYTSGTTGYAKAAVIKHYRYINLLSAIKYMFKIRDKDVIYISLPLYHANSCVMAGLALVYGQTIVIKDKFSVKDFWVDCIAYKCTVANYIGEMCRYLLAQPVKDCDTSHSMRLLVGNGLRPKIWHDFQRRFNIELIGEFYASTEGNANLVNITGREGACGFYPYYYGIFLRLFYPLAIIKVDQTTGEVVRKKNGLCIAVSPGEVGEIVGKIIAFNPLTHFAGYTNEVETNKKIISNVFRTGDKAFLSGDLLLMDSDGYLTFVDRTGDTFRWKGENVSTADVECVIQKITKLSDCVVFGVSINGYEGKAGMAVIAAPASDFDWKHWTDEIITQLPSYAIPVFVRLTDSIEMTGSFKLVKKSYLTSGYSPELTTDCIYFYDKQIKSYVLMDSKIYTDINNGIIKL